MCFNPTRYDAPQNRPLRCCSRVQWRLSSLITFHTLMGLYLSRQIATPLFALQKFRILVLVFSIDIFTPWFLELELGKNYQCCVFSTVTTTINFITDGRDTSFEYLKFVFVSSRTNSVQFTGEFNYFAYNSQWCIGTIKHYHCFIAFGSQFQK